MSRLRILTRTFCVDIIKSPTKYIFLAIAFGLVSFSILASAVLSLEIEPSFDRAYSSLKAPNISMSVDENVDIGMVSDYLANLNGVNHVEISRYTLASRMVTKERDLNFGFVMTNDSFEVPDEAVVVSDTIPWIGIGELVEIDVNGRSFDLIVSGIKISAAGNAPDTTVPYFWVSPKTFAAMTNDAAVRPKYNVEILSVEPYETETAILSGWNSYFGEAFSGGMTTYQALKNSFISKYVFMSKIFIFTSIFFTIVSAAVAFIFVKMDMIIQSERIRILKAVGYYERNMVHAFLVKYGFVLILGSVAGALLGGFILHRWLIGMFTVVNNPFFITNLCVWQAASILSVIVVFSLLTGVIARKYIYEYNIVHNEKASSRIKKLSLTILNPKLTEMSIAISLILRKKAEIAIIFILSLTTATLIITFTFVINSIIARENHTYDWGVVESDIFITRKSSLDEKTGGLLDYLNSYAEVDYYYAGLNDNLLANINGVNRLVLTEVFQNPINDRLTFNFIKGRNPINENETAVGVNFAQKHNVDVGDAISITRGSNQSLHTVTGIFSSFSNYGDIIRIVSEDIFDLFDNNVIGYYTVVLTDSGLSKQVISNLTEKFPDFDFYEMNHSSQRAVLSMLPPIVFISISSALLLSMLTFGIIGIFIKQEKYELTVFYAIGYSLRKIKLIYFYRIFSVMLVSILAAVPMSIFVTPRFINMISIQVGLKSFPMYPNIILVAIGAAISLLCCLLSVARLMKMKID